MPYLNRLILGLILASLTLGSAAQAREASSYEKWYVLQLNDQRAGHAVERQEVAADGQVSTRSELNFRLQRLGQEISISVTSEFVETADGAPLLMQVKQDLGLTAVEEKYRFIADGVLQESVTAGRTTRKKVPLPQGEWLTPNQARRFAEKRIAEGAQTFTYSIIDPSAGLSPVEQVHTIVGESIVEVFGKSVPAIEWQVTQSIMPGVVTTEFVDKKGVTVRTEVNLGGMVMVMLEADKELAMSKFSAPELMASTLVHPDKPIDDPRTVRKAEFILSRTDGGEIPEIPSCAAQTVTRINASSLRVVVDMDHSAPATESEVADARFRTASTTADSEDPAILKVTQEALEGAVEDPLQRAEVLRAFVREFISEKSLGVGFATASEVCATREGDCSEHGVLLAAMLRAAGIPSRAVSGLVYVDSFVGERQVFGFHMWTQALITMDGAPRWVDVDGTLPRGMSFDATHIALATSSLAEGDVVNSMASLATMLGNLTIKVVSIEH